MVDLSLGAASGRVMRRLQSVPPYTFYWHGNVVVDVACPVFPIGSCSSVAIYRSLMCANKTVGLCHKTVKEMRELEVFGG